MDSNFASELLIKKLLMINRFCDILFLITFCHFTFLKISDHDRSETSSIKPNLWITILTYVNLFLNYFNCRQNILNQIPAENQKHNEFVKTISTALYNYVSKISHHVVTIVREEAKSNLYSVIKNNCVYYHH